MYCLLQRALHLLSATVSFLCSPSAAANLHIICKTFYLDYLSTDKSKFNTNQHDLQLLKDFKTDQM